MKTQNITLFSTALLLLCSCIQGRPVGDNETYIDMDEFYQCHGFPCDEWAEVKENLRTINALVLQINGASPAEDAIEPTDDSLDGCLWITPSQSRQIIADLTEQLQHMDVRPNIQCPCMENQQTGGEEASRDERREATQEGETEVRGTEGEDAEAEKRRIKRKVADFSRIPWSNKWDMPVHWKFDGKHSKSDMAIIRNAVSMWEAETCIRFQELDTNAHTKEHHVIVTNSGFGCHAFIGKLPSNYNPQQLNLASGSGCLRRIGTALHEWGHTLGFFHQQQTANRDDHIRIDSMQLINNAYAGQYVVEKRTLDHGVAYDYASVMHYPASAGSRTGLDVILARDHRYQQTMGQRVEISFADAKQMNRLYCSDVCNPNELARPCENGGYQNPNECNSCKCPDGFTGKYCDKLQSYTGEQCGGELYATTDSQIIKSPGYDKGFYNSNQECNWRITAPSGFKVEFQFEGEFGMACGGWGECQHWVEVRNDDLTALGPRYCCIRLPREKIVSDKNEMLVLMRALSTETMSRRRGFSASYKAVPIKGATVPTEPPRTTTTTATTTTTTSKPTTTTTMPPTTTTTNRPPTTTTTTTTMTPTTTTTTMQPTTTTTTKPTTTTSMMEMDLSWSCGFESEVRSKLDIGCGIVQSRDDQFDWTRHSGGTPSDPTGPNEAFEGKYYIYIETSNPRRPKDQAVITLPPFNYNGKVCMTFRYHMFGFHTNTLKVMQETASDSKTVWKEEGEQGTAWFTANVEINLTKESRIQFVGIRGEEYSGDIAIDDIHISSGTC